MAETAWARLSCGRRLSRMSASYHDRLWPRLAVVQRLVVLEQLLCRRSVSRVGAYELCVVCVACALCVFVCRVPKLEAVSLPIIHLHAQVAHASLPHVNERPPPVLRDGQGGRDIHSTSVCLCTCVQVCVRSVCACARMCVCTVSSSQRNRRRSGPLQ